MSITPGSMKKAAHDSLAAEAHETAYAPHLALPEKKNDPAKAWRWIALLGAGLADALSTRAALKRPGVIEGNPILRPIAHNTPALIAAKLATNAAIAAGADFLRKKGYHGEANAVAFGSAGAQAAIAAKNTQTGKHRE